MSNRQDLRRDRQESGIGAGFSLIPINRETKRPCFKLLPLLFDGTGVPVMRPVCEQRNRRG